MSSPGDDDDANANSSAPSIKFTRKRTTTKTRTAASSARRRNNLPLVHASGAAEDDSSGKDQHSWFARKSKMMTDSQIRGHLVSGGANNSGRDDGVSFIGDMIVGAKEEKKKKKQRRGGPRFAWEEEDDDDEAAAAYHETRMTAAPTLMDIMDEKDEVDLMSPLTVNKSFGGIGTTQTQNSTTSKKRPRNEALAHLAIFSQVDRSGPAPTDGNSSIGWNILRVMGYRPRLGVALVPLQGFKTDKCLVDSLDKNATHEMKWLADKKLRAIYLPSVQSVDNNSGSKSKVVDVGADVSKKAKTLVIPPPKTNRHGIGYDPFKNAPEFRAFHEQRKRMAQKQGRDGEESADKKRKHRYLTDDLTHGVRKPWESANEKDDLDDDASNDSPHHDTNNKGQHSHYAAERNYEHLIGSKASSGFALEDGDDENVYDGGDHGFPQRDKQIDGEMSNYNLEIHSPAASDDEDEGHESNLFGNTSSRKTNSSINKSNEVNGEHLADAWSSWGFGTGDSSNGSKSLTQDGKPPLPGFILNRRFPESKANNQTDSSRWEGPKVPPGYVLKHHIFTKEEISIAGSQRLARNDCGLGLDLQNHSSQHRQSSKSMILKVLPTSADKDAPLQKMVAKDGTALNFHAVRESMKNRFVSGSTDAASQSNNSNLDVPVLKVTDGEQEEWIDVTITTWLPARLLCKRWNVPIPAEYGGADVSGAVKRSGEEEYFQNTIYDPAINQRDQDTANDHSDAKKQFFDTTVHNDEDDHTAAPTRPSNAIFQSIFDVESDIDESDIVNADTLQHASEINEFDIHGRARKKRQQNALDRENSEANPAASRDTVAVLPSADKVDHNHKVNSSNKKPLEQEIQQPDCPLHSDESFVSHDENKRKHKHSRRDDSDSDESDRRRRKRKSRSHKKKRRRKDKR